MTFFDFFCFIRDGDEFGFIYTITWLTLNSRVRGCLLCRVFADYEVAQSLWSLQDMGVLVEFCTMDMAVLYGMRKIAMLNKRDSC